ncbi:MAG: hypothetical protein Q9Q40_01025 [Acidobacteriota bacterium]|nr:hypothetical protein [Acidobacteriota bacterium]
MMQRPPRMRPILLPAVMVLLLAVMVLLLAASLAWAGATVARAGTLSVEISAPGPHGGRVRLVLPAGIVDVALAMLPGRLMPDQARETFAPYGALAGLLADSLPRLPEVVLVSVDAPRHKVRVAQEGSCLVIQIVDHEQSVHLRIPRRTLEAVLRRVERMKT